MGSRPTTCVLDRARKVTSPLRATSGDADHLAHFGEANIKIADGNICGRNSHNHLVLFAEPLGGIKRPIAGLGILALSRIINSKRPAKTAALARPNMINSIENGR
jgi:hypothetical protein